MKKWKIWTAFISVFAAGIIVGVTGVGLMLQLHFAPPKDPTRFRAKIQERILSDIEDKVQPDKATMVKILESLQFTLDELETIRTEAHPRLKATFKRGKERIRQHLTPEQAQRFDEMIEDRKKGRFGLFRLPPPPPPMH